MAINSVPDPSAAISAYSAQQHQTTVARSANRDSSSQPAASTQAADAAKKAKGEQVTFTNEALRLSAQNTQHNQANNTVNQATAPQNANTYPPQSNSQEQAYQVSGAQSMTQAINTYHNTFKL
jgi:hypothetical protein